MSDHPRAISVTKRSAIPWLSILLGFGPILVISFGAVAAWLTNGLLRNEIVLATATYAASILAFLAGVRRGLSFRTQGGPALSQLATMLGLFILALFALIAIGNSITFPSIAATTIGFAASAILDPIAASAGQAPLFFGRLRPPQMVLAVVSLSCLLANVWLKG